MIINQLYNTWIQQISKLRPGQRITQVRNFVWLMVGIYQSRSVNLSRITGKIPGRVQLLSYTRRLSRFLNNPSIDVREWYESIAQSWIKKQAQCLQQVRLIVDGTKIGFGHQLLMVGLAYRKRAILLAWTWVPYVRGHSTAEKQLTLLTYVHSLLPQGIATLLVGDTEFGPVSVLQQLDQWRWRYVLRQKSSTKIYLASETEWIPFRDAVHNAGESLWLGEGWLTERMIYPVNLLAHWKKGEKEAWLLATNLPDKQMAIQAYSLRMWIEEMFGDMKGHGFDLEKTMLRYEDRLSRLTLAVAMLYVWLFPPEHAPFEMEKGFWSIVEIGVTFVFFKLVCVLLIVNLSTFLISRFYFVLIVDFPNCQVARPISIIYLRGCDSFFRVFCPCQSKKQPCLPKRGILIIHSLYKRVKTRG